jgi:hypothetical protein
MPTGVPEILNLGRSIIDLTDSSEMSDPDPTDIALYLIGNILEEAPEDTYLYQMDLHKILYMLQRDLDDSNAVAANLPFHWYLHGPVSQAAFDAGDVATRTGIASAEEDRNCTKFSPGPEMPPSPSIDSEDLDEAVTEVSKIVDGYRFHDDRDQMLQNEIYVDAPYRFQREFKFNTLRTIEEFSQSREMDNEVVLSALSRAEGKLPLDGCFKQFNTEFSRYVSLADLFLTQETEPRPMLRGQLSELADITWRTFCNLLRCETVDKQYYDEVARWERKADLSLSTYKKDLDDFESRLLDEGLYTTDVSRAAKDESWTKIANSILNES